MKLGYVASALILGFGLVAPAVAQEDAKKEEPAKEAAAAPAAEAKPAAEAAPAAAAAPAEAKPAAEAAPAAAAAPAEAKPAAEAAPAAAAAPAEAKPAAAPAPAAAAAPAKELSGCAKGFVPLADTYKSAYDDMQKWIDQISTETLAAGEKVVAIQTQITTNETAITQAKLNKDDSKAKSLQKENKKLWDDFNAAKKTQSEACAKYVKEAPQRIKQYSDATSKALDALKSQK